MTEPDDSTDLPNLTDVTTQRILITEDPFLPLNTGKPWRERGLWPASWITHPRARPPFVAAFRKQFTLDQAATIRIHISADQRYQLYLDGRRIGQGPERGAPDLWFYESYDLALDPGAHVLVARVWHWGEHAPQAQMSVTPGFLLAAEGEWQAALSTGLSAWECALLDGYTFGQFERIPWKGGNTYLDGRAYPWGVEHGHGANWTPAQTLRRAMARRLDWELPPQHILAPASLPPIIDEARRVGVVRFAANVETLDTRDIPIRSADHDAEAAAEWQRLVSGEGEARIPPRATRRILIDLQDYFLAYAEITVSGGAGAIIRIRWAEALNRGTNLWRGDKGQRDDIEGKFVLGNGDQYISDGGARRAFAPLWWSAGRYVEVVIQTLDEPLTVNALIFRESRYPLDMESAFEASDERLNEIMPILARGIQCTANETYFDGPHWEEIMYLGDTRLEALCTYVMSRDDRLPRKALRMFDVSRLSSGLTQSRYPCSLLQIIPPFSLWWVLMAHDFALWRGDAPFVRSLMPGVRAVLEGYARWIGDDGLLRAPEGWNFMDWAPAWHAEAGAPPDGVDGVSGLLNWHYVYALTQAAALEAMLGETAMAARWRAQAKRLAQAASAAFWDESRGLMADTLARDRFSEHTQCMAVLSGQIDARRRRRVLRGLLGDPDLERCTIYFSFYLFEALRALNRADAILDRLQLWFDLKANGLRTPVEQPEPTRSDCHGWGSHPLFHYFATILGIRPAAFGFGAVEIRPQLGRLTRASGRLVHPRGEIAVDFHVEDGRVRGTVRLPAGVRGVLIANGERQEMGLGASC
ncbi:MAG: alpha-L-rhamnosidase C-terminal domain-containing protein [Candidatus Brachytrichaceae bacterium NZ_4S206]